MAILEINLEKPALVEEYQYPGETTAGKTKPGESSRGGKSSGGKGKLVGLLAVLAGVGLLAWKLKSRKSGSKQSDFEDFDEQSQQYEHGPEPEIGGDQSGGAKRKVASVLGLAVALVGVVAAVRKARS